MECKLLLIDQDGVLADFDLGIREAWLRRYGVPAPLGERHHFYLRDDMAPAYHQQLHALYSGVGFFANLPPIEAGLDAIQRLLAAGHDVRICTSPIHDYQHCVTEKFDWVRQHLGESWLSRIVLTKDKTWVRGDILIDDKPQISGSLSPLWQHWLYDQPYNRDSHHPHRVRWSDERTWACLLPLSGACD